MKISKDVPFSVLATHFPAVWLVSEVMKEQAQRMDILKADDKSFTVGLRVNLQSIQVERLILKPLNEFLDGYTVNADLKEKTVEFVKNAGAMRKAKPVGNGE